MPYIGDWKPTKDENPVFKCRGCDSNDILYIRWESSDEAHEDIKYHCQNCQRVWWVEGIDS